MHRYILNNKLMSSTVETPAASNSAICTRRLYSLGQNCRLNSAFALSVAAVDVDVAFNESWIQVMVVTLREHLNMSSTSENSGDDDEDDDDANRPLLNELPSSLNRLPQPSLTSLMVI